jgi:polyisoprenyl-phosphate glycosyltransferase
VYSVVIPVFNEILTLPELERRIVCLLDQLDAPGEVILVDDGSTDGSFEHMEAMSDRDPRFRLIRLSRNFGHQIAITAGLEAARGHATIVMDGDLQDPPEVALEMIERWKRGFDVVYAVRKERAGEPWGRKQRAAIFYRVLHRVAGVDIPVDVGDFRLVDRRALDAFLSMPESNRFVRGMFSWVGFRQTSVEYARDARHAGDTKYPMRKLVKLGADGILSFSNAPLRLALQLGFAISALSFLAVVYVVIGKVAGLYEVQGVASLTALISFLGGILLLVVGVQGEYIARIYDEVKRRPLYVVSDLRGFERELPPRTAHGDPREWAELPGGVHVGR